MTRKINSVSRRAFLRGFGSSLLAVPFVSGLANTLLHASEGAAGPLRFVMIFTGNNQLPEHWVPPDGLESGFALAPALEPLAPLRSKLLLAHGMYGTPGHSGGMSETTTGRPSTSGDGVATGGPSIDQYLANVWRGDTPLPSLEVGVYPGNNPSDQICYSSNGLPIPAIGSPAGAFGKVVNLTNEDPEQARARRAQEGSVLDVIAGDLSAARPRLGARTRVLLDEHLSQIRARERELEVPFEPLSCDVPAPPGAVPEHIERVWDAHNDTLSIALRCGSTRVASLRVGGWGGAIGYDSLGLQDAHHKVSHGGTSDPEGDLLAINRWHATRVHALCERLDMIPTTDGATMLDDTVVVWFNELGLGGVNNHTRWDIPVVLLGGARAGLRNDLYCKFEDTHYQDFLYTLARTIGDPSLARFGNGGVHLLEELLA